MMFVLEACEDLSDCERVTVSAAPSRSRARVKSICRRMARPAPRVTSWPISSLQTRHRHELKTSTW